MADNSHRKNQGDEIVVEKTTDRREWYRKVYLRSEHWRRLRAAKLYIDPRCQRCGATGILDVHHLEYRNVFDATLDDLETLCRKCHVKEHADHPIQARKSVPKHKLRTVKKMHQHQANPMRGFAAYHIFDCKCVLCKADVGSSDFVLFAIRPREGFSTLSNMAIRCRACSRRASSPGEILKIADAFHEKARTSNLSKMIFRALTRRKGEMHLVTRGDVLMEIENDRAR